MIRNRQSRSDTRHGMTLIELLVVVAMLIILVSVLTAAMQPVLEGKEVREATRGLNAFIAGSVARAAENGRPAGVWIQRSANSNAAFDVFFADVPPIYAGDLAGASAYTDPPPTPPTPIPPPTIIRFTGGVASLQTLVQPGDSKVRGIRSTLSIQTTSPSAWPVSPTRSVTVFPVCHFRFGGNRASHPSHRSNYHPIP